MNQLKKLVGAISTVGAKPEKNVNLSANPVAVIPSRPPIARMVQNFRLVWLDASIDEVKSDDCRNCITNLRQVVNTVNTFINADECIDFINNGTKEETIFMIFSGALGQKTVPLVHDKSQVSIIYIYCGNKVWHEKWAKEWPKVEGVYTNFTPICEALKQAARDCDQNLVSISFFKLTDGASNQNLDALHQSFMYTQILKEILLTIHFEQVHINDFLTFCREQFAGNSAELKNVDKIEKEYRDHQPIWWYTYECLLYSMLNRALRTMEIDLIIKMGFFIRDLHQHIAALHAEQYGGHHHSEPFTVYRGQGLSEIDFEQLKNTQGGLLSFNNFLFTSKNRDTSLDFARRTIGTSNLVSVLFTLKIDPSISATHFANVGNVSCHQGEEEILFSMHSVFRIGKMEQIDDNDRLWQVDLTLTSENDLQLYALTESMRKDISSDYKGWHRFGVLLIKVGQFDRAEELYQILLQQTTNDDEKGHLFHQLGWIKNDQGNYAEAAEFHEKSLDIRQKTLSENHPSLAIPYNNIGNVYYNTGDYTKALSYYEKALEIKEKTLPANHPSLAISYNNIGLMHKNMNKYSKALPYYEKALEIREETLPANHPHLATSYNNIGWLYRNIGDYSKALPYYERALDIKQRSLPPNHPDIQVVRESIEIVKKDGKC